MNNLHMKTKPKQILVHIHVHLSDIVYKQNIGLYIIITAGLPAHGIKKW